MNAANLSVVVGLLLTIAAMGAPEDERRAIGQSGDTSAILAAAVETEKHWPSDIGTYGMSYRGLIVSGASSTA